MTRARETCQSIQSAVRAVVPAAIVAGVACTALDQLHVATGTLVYLHPDLWGQPWWVAPQFILLLGLGLVIMRLACSPTVGSGDSRTLVIDAAVMAGAYAASSQIGSHAIVGTLAFTVLWMVRIALREHRTKLLVASVAIGIAGPVYEGSLIALGTFHYAHPTLAGVPLWLPALYLNAGPLLQSARAAARYDDDGE